jgi:hypothetical protein
MLLAVLPVPVDQIVKYWATRIDFDRICISMIFIIIEKVSNCLLIIDLRQANPYPKGQNSGKAIAFGGGQGF